MVIVIVRLLLAKIVGCGAGKLSNGAIEELMFAARLLRILDDPGRRKVP
jgi:hypothetical protein